MKFFRFAVLALFLCGAVGFQLFSPSETLLSGQIASAQDELTNTYWNIDGTIYALNFGAKRSVRFLEYNSRKDDFDTVARGTYSIRGNTVTLNFGGVAGNVVISGRKRNKMTGKFSVDGERYVITATRAGD
jgi:hypothetical protein